jgi:hypothetical protein
LTTEYFKELDGGAFRRLPRFFGLIPLFIIPDLEQEFTAENAEFAEASLKTGYDLLCGLRDLCGDQYSRCIVLNRG